MFIYHDYLMFLHAQVNQKSTKSIWNNWIIPKQEKKKKKEWHGEKKSDSLSNKYFIIYYQWSWLGLGPAKKHTPGLMQAVGFSEAGMVNKELPLSRKQS